MCSTPSLLRRTMSPRLLLAGPRGRRRRHGRLCAVGRSRHGARPQSAAPRRAGRAAQALQTGRDPRSWWWLLYSPAGTRRAGGPGVYRDPHGRGVAFRSRASSSARICTRRGGDRHGRNLSVPLSSSPMIRPRRRGALRPCQDRRRGLYKRHSAAHSNRGVGLVLCIDVNERPLGPPAMHAYSKRVVTA